MDGIIRNGNLYAHREGTDAPMWSLGTRAWIVETEDGYRWQSRRGEWIDYDAEGRMRAYGDPNSTRLQVQRDAEGLMTTLRDHYGRAVMHVDYDADGHPVELCESRGQCGLAMPRTLAGGNPARVIASHEPGIEPCRGSGNRLADA